MTVLGCYYHGVTLHHTSLNAMGKNQFPSVEIIGQKFKLASLDYADSCRATCLEYRNKHLPDSDQPENNHKMHCFASVLHINNMKPICKLFLTRNLEDLDPIIDKENFKNYFRILDSNEFTEDEGYSHFSFADCEFSGKIMSQFEISLN